MIITQTQSGHWVAEGNLGEHEISVKGLSREDAYKAWMGVASAKLRQMPVTEINKVLEGLYHV